jgi:hypothetical protein
MNTLKHYHIESSVGKFELHFEDDYLQRKDIIVDPSMFKHLCVALSNQIVSYEEEHGIIDITENQSAKKQMGAYYDQKELIAYQIDYTSTEFKITLTIKSFISSEEYVLNAEPGIAKLFVIDCSNAIIQYEEMYGTIEL